MMNLVRRTGSALSSNRKSVFRLLSSTSAAAQDELPRSTTTNLTRDGSRQRPIRNRDRLFYDNRSPQLFDWTQQIVAGELTLEELQKRPEYNDAVNAICDTTRHSEKNILNLVKSVIIMNIDPEERVVKHLENELLHMVDSYDLRLLMDTYSLFSHLADTSESRRKLVNALHRNMSERLESTEASFADLILLIKMSRDFPTSILIQIDQQITRYLDYHEDITLDNLCYLLVLLSRFNRRNKPLIRNVVSKLLQVKNHDVYTMPPHLINMLSALSRLNYYEINLIEKTVDILIKFDFWERNSDSSKRDFLVGVSQFNFFNSALIEYFLQNLTERPELFKRQDLISLMITFARLNCQQPELVEIIKTTVIPMVGDTSEGFVSNLQWFNYVYALTFMNVAKPEMLKSLLSIEAFKKLENAEAELYTEKMNKNTEAQSEKLVVADVKDIYQVMNLRRKWLTFVGLCRIDMEQYRKLFDDPTEMEIFGQFVDALEFIPLKRSKDLDIFRAKIQKLLENITPPEGNYYQFDKHCKFGFSIDVELNVNPQGLPQPLNDSNPDNKRIALMCVGFNDTQLDSSADLIGAKESEFRILRSLGYVVVPVHQNVLQDATALGKVTFLQNLIVQHLKESGF